MTRCTCGEVSYGDWVASRVVVAVVPVAVCCSGDRAAPDRQGCQRPRAPLLCQDATTLLRVQRLNVMRSTTSSFMLLAHIVALTESVAQAGQRYRDTVKRGTQPPLSG